MKRLLLIPILFVFAGSIRAQTTPDSIGISRFLITDHLLGANWRDTLRSGHFENYLAKEIVIWRNSNKPGEPHSTFKELASRIKQNGTEDVAKCFIPRHSVNYYYQGKVYKYLLICFECDGLRFSDDPSRTFIKKIPTREKQLQELKILFTPLID